MAEAEVERKKGDLAKLKRRLPADLAAANDVETKLSKDDRRVVRLAQVVAREMEMHRDDAALYRDLIGEVGALRSRLSMNSSPIDSEKLAYAEIVDKLAAAAISRCSLHRQFYERAREFHANPGALWFDPEQKTVPAYLTDPQ